MFNPDQKRAFIAVMLSGLVLFGWQYFFAPPTPAPAKNNESKSVVSAPVSPTGASTVKEGVSSPVTAETLPSTIIPFTLKNGPYQLTVNNDLSIVNMINPNSVFDFNSLSDTGLPLRVQVITDYGPLDLFFDFNQTSPSEITGINSNYGVNIGIKLLENGKANLIFSSTKPYKFRLAFSSKEKTLDNGQIRHFSVYTNEVTNIEVGDEEEKDGNVKWVGTDFNYHLFAFVFPKDTPARYKTTKNGDFFIEIPNTLKEFSGSLVFTKKNYDELIDLGDNLHLAVDFGFFAILAVPTLRALQYVYNFIPNYGIAIILVTILIRLITFPLQYKSFKSMKKMQIIQPELQKIKDKYKDEPQKMQKETMELFKKAGANPLSGCLPLLLQMPFFFAIYKVLYSSVELVGAPFYGWIHDLSIHDPYYILPVLMTVSMFAQQKLTPQTSMDPTQQKIMLFMPIIFGFIMKSLPAGLVLYILVSTVVGILQQMIVYKMAD